MDKKPVRVSIFNQSYTLLASGDASEVETLAQEVDELLHSISGKVGTADSTRIAVLACLHLADRLRTRERDLNQINSKSEQFALLLDQAIGS
ncbi:MAG TPA: cell division protein ZapA [Solibacterales bacterium]|nr:cell division protein ZapA [Bryobacterales bacterium]